MRSALATRIRPLHPMPVLGLLALALLAGACQRKAANEPAPNLEAEDASLERPWRALRALQPEHVTSSPLLEAKDDLKSEELEVFREDFSQTSPNVGSLIPAAKDKALRLRDSELRGFQAFIPVKPNGRYRVSRAVRSESPTTDLMVLQIRTKLPVPGEPYHPRNREKAMTGTFVSASNLVSVHRFPAPSADAWRVDELVVDVAPDAYALMLMVDGAEGVVRTRRYQVDIDALRVAELKSTPAEVIAQVATQAPLAEAPTASLGIAKHGQFLPTGTNTRSREQGENNYDYREALFAPAPTGLRIPLVIDAADTLHLGTGLHRASPKGTKVRFVAAWEPKEGKSTTLLDEVVEAASLKSWRWHDHRLPLHRLLESGGREGNLVLRTEVKAGSIPLAMWSSPVITNSAKAYQKPNVLVVAVDTLRADRMSLYGHERPTTPNLDALGKESIVFDQAISTSNWTTSSFASIFLSQMPSEHRVIHKARKIASSEITFPELFQAAGLQTHAVMYKAYLYNMGFEQGFDAWFNVPRIDNTGADNLREAKAWLNEHADAPFMLFFHLNDPHQPFNQPAPFDRKFVDDKVFAEYGFELPITIGTKNRIIGCPKCGSEKSGVPEAFKEAARGLYDGAVAFVDQQVGALIDELRTRGIYDNTTIVFVADHGEVMWEHNNYFGHGGSLLTDSLTRVPFLIKPAKSLATRAGAAAKPRRVAGAVSTMNLAPTLLALHGLEVPSSMRGEDLLSTEAAGPALSENVKHGVFSARTSQEKVVVRTPSTLRRYDLQADPNEQKPLKGDAPAALVEHIAQARAASLYQTCEGGPPSPKTSQLVLKTKSWVLVEGRAPGAVESDSSRCDTWAYIGDFGPEEAETKDAMDAEQLEALRAMGYIE